MSRKAVLTYVAPLAIGLATSTVAKSLACSTVGLASEAALHGFPLGKGGSEAALHGSLHAVDLKSFISITEKTL